MEMKPCLEKNSEIIMFKRLKVTNCTICFTEITEIFDRYINVQ